MSRTCARLLVSASLGLVLGVSPAALAGQTAAKPTAAADAAKPARTGKPTAAVKASAAKRPAAPAAAKPAARARKTADCDVPAEKAKVAASAPVPVAADPLAPTVTPCPPGAAPGAGGKH